MSSSTAVRCSASKLRTRSRSATRLVVVMSVGPFFVADGAAEGREVLGQREARGALVERVDALRRERFVSALAELDWALEARCRLGAEDVLGFVALGVDEATVLAVQRDADSAACHQCAHAGLTARRRAAVSTIAERSLAQKASHFSHPRPKPRGIRSSWREVVPWKRV